MMMMMTIMLLCVLGWGEWTVVANDVAFQKAAERHKQRARDLHASVDRSLARLQRETKSARARHRAEVYRRRQRRYGENFTHPVELHTEDVEASMHGGPVPFGLLDKDRNDVVSLEEMTLHGWPPKRFFSCDADGNGAVSREEYRSASVNGAFVSFVDADANHDGVVSAVEWREGVSADYFVGADLDGDGVVSREEWIMWPYGQGYGALLDVNADGSVSENEWLDMGWSASSFRVADVDGDGRLLMREMDETATGPRGPARHEDL